MPIFSVSYDLNVPGQKRQQIDSRLQRLGIRYCETSWLVETQGSAAQLYASLRPIIDENDRLLVIGVTADYKGWLGKDAIDWIQKRL